MGKGINIIGFIKRLSDRKLPDSTCILIVVVVAIITVVFVVLASCDSPSKAASKAAKIALMASVDNPESVEIQAISKPDSIFGQRYVTEKEMTAIGELMMKASDSISRAAGGLETIGLDNPQLNNLMTRQMSAMSVMRGMMFTLDDDKSKKDFSGWKVKIVYQAKGKEGYTYKSEFWAILDKTGEHVVKSFEVPLL